MIAVIVLLDTILASTAFSVLPYTSWLQFMTMSSVLQATIHSAPQSLPQTALSSIALVDCLCHVVLASIYETCFYLH